jgi:hypothetical protein
VKSLIIRYWKLWAIIATIIFWGIVVYLVPAQALVESIGVENAYVISFFIAAIAGFSTFSGGVAYAAVIEFAQGGANPLLLGIASGTGLFISDSIFYALLMRGRKPIERKLGKLFTTTHRIVSRVPAPIVYILIFLFCAFGPIPNDLILGALVVAGYEYRKFWPALLAGDIAMMLMLSHLFQM